MPSVKLPQGEKRKKIPLVYLIATNAFLVAMLILQFLLIRGRSEQPGTVVRTEERAAPGRLIRNQDYRLVRPLRLVESPETMAGSYQTLKHTIDMVIRQHQTTDGLVSASVYFSLLADGSWISVNNGEPYHAGSLLKVPVMISFLKKEDERPGYLDKEVYFNRPPGKIAGQSYSGKAIEVGKSYSFRELLHYMIVESDNNATYLLQQHMDVASFQRVFTDIGLDRPSVAHSMYALTAAEYSRFLRILYNASYLSEKQSELALDLLTRCAFYDGLTRKLPEGTVVAHKFGESGTGEVKELSDSGVVYLNGDTYLLTVMTKGRDLGKMADAIGDISKEVFDYVDRRLLGRN